MKRSIFAAVLVVIMVGWVVGSACTAGAGVIANPSAVAGAKARPTATFYGSNKFITGEIALGNKYLSQIRHYQKQNLPIGLDPVTLAPDGFLKFFVERQLPFAYYVQNPAKGIRIGDPGAYEADIKTLDDYLRNLAAIETTAVKAIIAELGIYRDNSWAIGLNGDTLQPDGFVPFFAVRDLPFAYFVNGVPLGDASAYVRNIETLQNYLRKLGSGTSETPWDKMNLVGSALVSGSNLVLTTDYGQGGGAWLVNPISTTQSFTTTFKFNISPAEGSYALADGIAFVLQNTGNTALGDNGGQLGVLGLQNAAGSAIRTYTNNQIGLFSGGTVDSGKSFPYDLSSGFSGTETVTYNASNHTLSMTGTITFPDGRTVSISDNISIDLQQVFGPLMYAGFTGATGEAYSKQEITEWSGLQVAPGQPKVSRIPSRTKP